MPKIRNQRLVDYIRFAHGAGYTYKQAYLEYKKANESTDPSNIIDSTPLTVQRFKELFYRIKREDKGKGKLFQEYRDLNKDYREYRDKTIEGRPIKDIFSEIFSKKSDLPIVDSKTTGVLSDVTDFLRKNKRSPLHVEVGDDGIKYIHSEGPDLYATLNHNLFNLPLEDLLDETFDERILGAYRELKNFYDEYYLTHLIGNKEFAPAPYVVRPIDKFLLKWYIRLRELTRSAESLDLQPKTFDRLRQLRVLGAEQLALWESNKLPGVTMSRPSVEDVFYTEFWRHDEEKFESIMLNGYKSNVMSAFKELWDIYDIKSKKSKAYFNPQSTNGYLKEDEEDLFKALSDLLDKWVDLCVSIGAVSRYKDEDEYEKKEAYKKARVLMYEGVSSSSHPQLYSFLEDIKHPLYHYSEISNIYFKNAFMEFVKEKPLQPSVFSLEMLLDTYPGEHRYLNHDLIKIVRLPGAISKSHVFNKGEYSAFINWEGSYPKFMFDVYPLKYVQRYCLSRRRNIPAVRFFEFIDDLPELNRYKSELFKGNKKTFEADNDYLKYFADFMKKYLNGFHIGSDLP